MLTVGVAYKVTAGIEEGRIGRFHSPVQVNERLFAWLATPAGWLKARPEDLAVPDLGDLERTRMEP